MLNLDLRHTLVAALLLPLALAATCPRRLLAAEVPAGTAVLELQLPPGAKVSADGHDYGTSRRLTYKKITPGKLRSTTLTITFADGTKQERVVHMDSGQMVRLAMQAASRSKPELVVQAGGIGLASDAAFSPDGRYIVTKIDSTAILWDLESGKALRAYGDGSKTVSGLAITADGMRVMTAARDGGTITFYDLVSGTTLSSVPKTSCLQVALSDNGRRIITRGDGAAIWDATTGHRLSNFKSRITNHVAISFDGTQAAMCSLGDDDSLVLWDASTGQKRRTLVAGKEFAVPECCFSKDAQKLVGVRAPHYSWQEGDVEQLTVWDTNTGQRLVTTSIQAAVGNLGFLHDDQEVVSTEGAGIVFRDAATLRVTRALTPSGYKPTLAVLNLDGSRLFDGKAVWDTASRRVIQVLDGRIQSISTVAFSATGEEFLVGREGQPFAALDDLSSLANVVEFSAGGESDADNMCMSAGGRRVFRIVRGEQSSLLVFDAANGREINRFPVEKHAYHPLVSRDGSRVLTKSEGDLYVRNVSNGSLLRRLDTKKSGLVYTLSEWAALSGSGAHILLTGSEHMVSGEAASGADGHRAAKLVDVATGKTVRDFRMPSQASRKTVKYDWDCVGFSSDDAFVAVGGNEEKLPSNVKGKAPGIVALWRTRTGELVRVLRGHERNVKTVAFSANGRYLVSRSYDGTAIVWEVATGVLLRRFTKIDNSRQSMSLSPDGRSLAIVGQDSVIRIWDVYTGEQLISYMRLNEGKDWLAVTPQGLFDGTEAGRQQVAFRIGGGLNVVPVDRFFQDFYRPGLAAELFGDAAQGGGGERPLPDVQIAAAVPPTLKIVSPTDSIVDSDQVTIEVEAKDEGGDIQGPWLRHNGARIPAAGEARREGDRQFHTFSVRLVEGENRLRVEAASADGSWESEPARLNLTYSKQLARPELYVLSVGVNKYADAALNLSFASPDAQAMADLFERRGERLYQAVRVRRLLDESATKAGIREALTEIAGQARPQDALLVFLSGHGLAIGQRYYFIPHEVKSESPTFEDDVRRAGLPIDELADGLGSVPALKRMLVLDTCNSGAAIGRSGGQGRNPFAFRGAIERLSRAQGIFTIAASASSESTVEVPALGHGVLTYSLLAGMKAVDDGPLADKWVHTEGTEPVVGVLDWFNFASGQVPRLTQQFTGQAQDVKMSGEGTSFPVLPLTE